MLQTVDVPVWLLVLLVAFATVTALSHFLVPSVRWFFRRRLERVVAQLNTRLERPIQPFNLARRHDMIERLIYDPQVAQAVSEHASETGVPESVAFEQARRYAREIVPSFSASAYFGFATRAARRFGNAFYRVRLGHYDDVGIRNIDPDATIVFVMNHRSNMDYVLVTYLAADRSALSYAVGEWAQVWPLSRLIRAMGAYFIRRESRNELYRRVLARYVALATRAGVTQAMFPEGGLSLTGGLAPPKLGLLKYITADFDPAGRDVVFVPVALNYDHVLEDRILIAATGASERRFKAKISVIFGKSLHQIWLRMSGQFHRFGYAAVSFGAPLSLSAYQKSSQDIDMTDLAQVLMHRIGAIVPVLPVPAVAWMLTRNGPMTRTELEVGLARLVDRIPDAHVHLPRNNRGYAVEVATRQLVRRGILALQDDVFHPVAEQNDVLEYYANSIRHLT